MKPIVYIVEDDEAVRDSLKLLLEIRGYDVSAFSDGRALMAHDSLPDDVICIILDVNLPGESGLQILHRLRARAVHVPAIMVSGRADDEMRAEAGRLDVLAFYDKPVKTGELLGMLSTLPKAAGALGKASGKPLT